MPLSVLALFVVLGVSAVVVSVYVFGDNAGRKLDENTARKRFTRDFPGFDPQTIVISDDGYDALLVSDNDSRSGLVHRIGKNYLTRLLERGSLRKMELTGQGIDLYVNDFTLQKISFSLADENLRKQVFGTLPSE
ncbi:MAG: hypothetical protein ACR2O3_17775 [Rhizobiaceae bacterium]